MNEKAHHQLALFLDELIDQRSEKFVKKLRSYWQRVTIRSLKNADSLAGFNADLKKWQDADTEELKRLIDQHYRLIGKTSVQRLNKEIETLDGMNPRISVSDINSGLRYRSKQLAREQVREFRKDLYDRVNQMDGTLKDKAIIHAAIRNASKVFANRHIYTTARNESTEAANQMRIQASRDSGIVKAFRFSAVDDDRTTDECHQRNGHIIRIDSPLLEKYTSPIHHGCRSLLTPITIYQAYTLTPIEDLQRTLPKNFGKSKMKLAKSTGKMSEAQKKKQKYAKTIRNLRSQNPSKLSKTDLNLLMNHEIKNAKKVLTRSEPLKEIISDQRVIDDLREQTKALNKISLNDQKKNIPLFKAFRSNLRQLQLIDHITRDDNFVITKAKFNSSGLPVDMSFEDKAMKRKLWGLIEPQSAKGLLKENAERGFDGVMTFHSDPEKANKFLSKLKKSKYSSNLFTSSVNYNSFLEAYDLF